MTPLTDTPTAAETLRHLLPRGSTVYLIARHRSRTGQTWWLGAYALEPGHRELHQVGGDIALLLGFTVDPLRDAFEVPDCLSIQNQVIEPLAVALYGDLGALFGRLL